MSDIPGALLGLSTAGGVVIGLLYFGTLWWTVRRIRPAQHSAALVAASFLIRAALAAGALVLVSGGDPLPLLAAVAGFLIARTILIRTVRKPLQAEAGGGHRAHGTGIAVKRE